MERDRALDLPAASRLGLVTRAIALAAGFTDDAIYRKVASGEWIQVHPGVYLIASTPRSWAQSLAAALLAAPGAVVSHRAAAIAWGFDGFGGRIVEISVPYANSPQLEGVITHRSTDLDPAWVSSWQGIAVTNPTRTLLDLGAVVRPWLVERAFDAAQGNKLVTLDGARAALETFGRRGRRGTGALRAIIDARTDVEQPAGVLEAQMASLLRQYGLPPMVPEYEVFDDQGRFVARVDFALPELRFALEVNGFEKHAVFPGFQRGHDRRNRLVLAGWEPIEFTYRDVNHRQEYVANTLLEAIAGRRPFFER